MGKVSFVIVASEHIDQRELEKTRDEFGAARVMREQHDALRGLGSRLRFEFDPAFLNTHFVTINDSDKESMLAAIRESDVAWVHTLRVANMFRIYRWPHSVLDIDDIPSNLYASRARSEEATIRSLFDRRMSLVWWRREQLLQDRFSAICVCSENDRAYLGNASNIHVVPNGFATPPHPPPRSPSVPARLGFIGLCEFRPNREGIEWFIKNVWPQIKRKAPVTRLRLIGLGSDRDLPQMGPDIDGLGYVEDPADEIASWAAMIVPIRIGAGTRVKIVDAFSRMCPVVSTKLGAFGYEVRDGNELILADSTEEFAAACLRVMADPLLGKKLSENSWKRFVSEWTWDAIGEAVEKTVQASVSSRNMTY
jgi:glycosyltransferase involved in cell wall biosynthesis